MAGERADFKVYSGTLRVLFTAANPVEARERLDMIAKAAAEHPCAERVHVSLPTTDPFRGRLQ